MRLLFRCYAPYPRELRSRKGPLPEQANQIKEEKDAEARHWNSNKSQESTGASYAGTLGFHEGA
jgi:hypothetical protein